MKKAVIILVAFFFTTAPLHAAPAMPKIGEPFTKARAQLYAAGWRADPLAHLSSGEHMGLERQLVENGYPEVDSCSEGLSFCILQYTKGDACLRIQTQGEQIRLMKVYRWSSECRQRAAGEEKNALPADVRYLLQWSSDCENFGQCRGIETYLLKLKRKYRKDLEMMRILNADKSPD